LPAGSVKGCFSLRHRVQIDSGALPVSYPVGTGALSPAVKRPGHEADHSPTSSAEVKLAWSYTSTRPYVFTAWCLVEHRIRLHGVVLISVQVKLYLYLGFQNKQ